MESTKPNPEEFKNATAEELNNASVTHRNVCQWFQAVLGKSGINHDRRLTLGGKTQYSACTAALTRFPEFLILGFFQMDRELGFPGARKVD